MTITWNSKLSAAAMLFMGAEVWLDDTYIYKRLLELCLYWVLCLHNKQAAAQPNSSTAKVQNSQKVGTSTKSAYLLVYDLV